MKISLIRGDDKILELHFSKAKIPQEIIGWKIYFTMKRYITDSDENAALKKDIIEHFDPENGKTQIVLTNEETDNLKKGSYIYDIQAKDSNGNIMTILMGRIIVTEDVTRRKT